MSDSDWDFDSESDGGTSNIPLQSHIRMTDGDEKFVMPKDHRFQSSKTAAINRINYPMSSVMKSLPEPSGSNSKGQLELERWLTDIVAKHSNLTSLELITSWSTQYNIQYSPAWCELYLQYIYSHYIRGKHSAAGGKLLDFFLSKDSIKTLRPYDDPSDVLDTEERRLLFVSTNSILNIAARLWIPGEWSRFNTMLTLAAERIVPGVHRYLYLVQLATLAHHVGALRSAGLMSGVLPAIVRMAEYYTISARQYLETHTKTADATELDSHDDFESSDELDWETDSNEGNDKTAERNIYASPFHQVEDEAVEIGLGLFILLSLLQDVSPLTCDPMPSHEDDESDTETGDGASTFGDADPLPLYLTDDELAQHMNAEVLAEVDERLRAPCYDPLADDVTQTQLAVLGSIYDHMPPCEVKSKVAMLLGRIAVAEHQPTVAESYYYEGLVVLDAIPHGPMAPILTELGLRLLMGYAEVTAALQKYKYSVVAYESAAMLLHIRQQLSGELDDNVELDRLHRELAAMCRGANDVPRATRYYAHVLAKAESEGRFIVAGCTADILSDIFRDKSDFTTAEQYLRLAVRFLGSTLLEEPDEASTKARDDISRSSGSSRSSRTDSLVRTRSRRAHRLSLSSDSSASGAVIVHKTSGLSSQQQSAYIKLAHLQLDSLKFHKGLTQLFALAKQPLPTTQLLSIHFQQAEGYLKVRDMTRARTMLMRIDGSLKLRTNNVSQTVGATATQSQRSRAGASADSVTSRNKVRFNLLCAKYFRLNGRAAEALTFVDYTYDEAEAQPGVLAYKRAKILGDVLVNNTSENIAIKPRWISNDPGLQSFGYDLRAPSHSTTVCGTRQQVRAVCLAAALAAINEFSHTDHSKETAATLFALNIAFPLIPENLKLPDSDDPVVDVDLTAFTSAVYSPPTPRLAIPSPFSRTTHTSASGVTGLNPDQLTHAALKARCSSTLSRISELALNPLVHLEALEMMARISFPDPAMKWDNEDVRAKADEAFRQYFTEARDGTYRLLMVGSAVPLASIVSPGFRERISAHFFALVTLVFRTKDASAVMANLPLIDAALALDPGRVPATYVDRAPTRCDAPLVRSMLPSLMGTDITNSYLSSISPIAPLLRRYFDSPRPLDEMSPGPEFSDTHHHLFTRSATNSPATSQCMTPVALDGPIIIKGDDPSPPEAIWAMSVTMKSNYSRYVSGAIGKTVLAEENNELKRRMLAVMDDERDRMIHRPLKAAMGGDADLITVANSYDVFNQYLKHQVHSRSDNGALLLFSVKNTAFACITRSGLVKQVPFISVDNLNLLIQQQRLEEEESDADFGESDDADTIVNGSGVKLSLVEVDAEDVDVDFDDFDDSDTNEPSSTIANTTSVPIIRQDQDLQHGDSQQALRNSVAQHPAAVEETDDDDWDDFDLGNDANATNGQSQTFVQAKLNNWTAEPVIGDLFDTGATIAQQLAGVGHVSSIHIIGPPVMQLFPWERHLPDVACVRWISIVALACTAVTRFESTSLVLPKCYVSLLPPVPHAAHLHKAVSSSNELRLDLREGDLLSDKPSFAQRLLGKKSTGATQVIQADGLDISSCSNLLDNIEADLRSFGGYSVEEFPLIAFTMADLAAVPEILSAVLLFADHPVVFVPADKMKRFAELLNKERRQIIRASSKSSKRDDALQVENPSQFVAPFLDMARKKLRVPLFVFNLLG
ncbi:DFA family protein [Carpediemonas membranifera]|uniref:DFA family protein n=1 Tax=Carpediemonas membranifera TaxID=201153 RepID=A0A8J6B7G4_9EUKA|nr:DFA family protein [Carpediemonas membranifera]|eukprot:KAG9394709.1 DFA family protein [Carpediemonas membranifera]